jgi:hypothetical protein
MSLPVNPVEAGQGVSANGINRMVEELAARTPVNSGVGHVQQRSGGTVTTRKPSWSTPAPRRGAASFHPFQVFDASTTGPDVAKIRVRFGQVNSVTPTMDGDDLDANPTPVLVVITGVIYLELTLDIAGVVTAVEVLNAASLPAATATEGYITLATVTVTSDQVTAINQSVTASLQYLRCNGNDIFGAV